ncbi:MAG: type II secretion system F family protein [Candidatus Sericytochromatia bacterium]|nr:type II secretion system F family protein [Candidatus Sericytochromatia bacterium]
MTWLIFALFFISIMLIVLAFARPQSSEEASARLDYLRSRQSKGESESKASFQERSREQLAPLALRMLPAGLQQTLRQKLDGAGKYDTSVAHYAVNTLILTVAMPLGFWLLNSLLLEYETSTLLYALPALAALGYYYPLIRLNSQIESRRRAMFRALPDFVDLLTICLEAGMGLDAALNLVVRKAQPGPLRDELERTIKEIRVGKTRAQALKDMARRLDMKEITSFVVAIVQAEQIGSNLSATLKVQSEITRESRWQKAQELAQKAPVKMLFPMLLLIFPNIFLMIFGPILLGFMLGRL